MVQWLALPNLTVSKHKACQYLFLKKQITWTHCEFTPNENIKQPGGTTKTTQLTRFMGPTWGPPGPWWPQMGPMNLAIRGSARVSTACGSYTNSLILDECKVLGHFQMHFLRIFILWFKWHRHLLSKVGSTSICNASASMMTKSTGTFRAVV